LRVQIAGRHKLVSAAAITAVTLAVLLTRPGFAGVEEQSVWYNFHYFSDVDGLNVYTHYAGYRMQAERNVAVSLQWAHDIVVFPAIDAAPGSDEAVDAITSASRPISGNTDPFEDFVKIRDEIQGSVSWHNVSAGYYVSTESDYFAQMVSGGYNHGFLGDNLNVAGGLSYSWDNIQPLADADTEGIADFRKTLHWNLVVTQILTPTTVVRIGSEFNRVHGLQHDPYRNVYVAGANVPELHPGYRNRRDVFLRISQYLTNRSSLKFDFRYYDDDWGVTSQTYGVKLSQYVTEQFVVRYRYRYYTQVPAYFFSDDYTLAGGVSGLRTGDYRLGGYGAHLFGGRVLWQPRGLARRIGFLKQTQFELSYERYFNSNNFFANVVETGLQISF
jgi:hypothetical protein